MAEFEFQPQQKVVYPAHGVGTVLAIDTQVIGGTEITTYVVHFERDKMTLRIPVKKAVAVGLRPLCTVTELKKVSKTLKSKPKIGRGMWSRRAEEYEGKINSGSIVSLAEVVRDLHRNVNDPDRSYSERVIYENALERLAGEVSAVRMIAIDQASNYLVKTINDNTPKEEEAVA